MLSLSRKDFLKLAGLTGALLLIERGPVEDVRRALAAAGEAKGEERRYLECGVCGAKCVLVARLDENGRIFKIEGDPRDPVSRGKPCVKGRNSFHMFYDPDRLKVPLKRTNPKRSLIKDSEGAIVGVEDPGWVEVSWDEALDAIADKIAEAIRTEGPQSIVFIGHGKGSDLASLIGTPNVIKHHTTCHSTRDVTVKASLGGSLALPDLANSKLIISFGHDMPGKSKNPFPWMFAEAKRKGARIVVFDPRLSMTANLADEWVPIRPGTDAAILLAMLNVVLTEGLYDEEFTRKYTNAPHLIGEDGLPVKEGDSYLVYDEIRGEVIREEESSRPALIWEGELGGARVRTALKAILEAVRDRTPEWASSISGVPAERIRELARDFARIKPACIPYWKRDGGLGPNRGQGVEGLKAATILMAITGNVEVRGGWVFNRTAKKAIGKAVSKKARKSLAELYPIPEEYRGKRIDEGEKFPIYFKFTKEGLYQKLWYNILNDDPYPVRVLLITAQSFSSFMDSELAVRAINHVVENGGIVVNINIYPDEVAALSDFVLPDRTFHTSSGIGFSKSIDFHARANFKEGLKDIYPNTRSNSSIFKELAYRIGEKLGISKEELKAEYLPESMVLSKQEVMERQVKRYSEIYGVKLTLEDLKRQKIVSIPWKPKSLTQLGTPSGRIEIYPTLLAEKGYDPLPRWRDEFTAKELGAGELVLVTSVFAMNRHTKLVNVDTIRTILMKHRANMIWIHPKTASELGVSEGDEVVVYPVRSFYSKGDGEFVEVPKVGVRGRVHVTEMIRRDCVFIPHGLSQYSKYMRSYMFAPSDGAIKHIWVSYSDPSGSSADQDVVVKVRRVM